MPIRQFMDPDSQSFEAILAIIPIAPMQFSNRSAQSPGGSPGSGLAPWAVIGGAAGKLDRRDLCAATRASPAPFTVRDEEGSGQPLDKPLGAGCGVNRRLQYLFDAAEQALLGVRAQSVATLPRMDAGMKEDLVG